MKIKCKQFECEVCGKVSTIQLFFRSNGELAYGRARHYIGRVNNKPQFEYHKQSLKFIEKHLGHDSIVNNVDLEKPQFSSKVKVMAGPKGFEPLTFSLEG
jgi:hypothetical protein